MSETLEKSTALVPLDQIALPVKFLTEEVTDAIENIRRAALAEADGLDISRPGDREKIKSVAHRVSKSKAAMEKLGKSLSDRRRAEIADEVNAIVAERKRIETELDALRDQIRKPVTDWENADKERIAKHEGVLAAINAATAFSGQDPTSAGIKERLDTVEFLSAHAWDLDFHERGTRAVSIAREDLEHRLSRALQREAEAAELEKLRAAEVERQRVEREARIAAVAAENAKREAEENARAVAAAEAARAEAERVATEQRAQAERDAAAARERDLEEQRKAAEFDRITAENRTATLERLRVEEAAAAEKLRTDQAEAAELARVRAQERAEQQQRDAIEAERARVARIAADEEAARARREQDKAHKGKVNAAARDAISVVIKGRDVTALADELAAEIVKAIALGKIPGVRIEY